MPPESSRAPDVVVVGGGIVGTATAAFLAGEGARVVLIERDGLASHASGANSGVLQHPFDPILAALYHETVALYRELSVVSTNFSLAERPHGMLFVSEQEAAAAAQAALVRATFPELSVEVLGPTDLGTLEPALAPGIWACRVDIGYPVMPGASTYAYASLAESRGVRIRQGRGATLEFDGGAVTGVRVNGQLLAADAVVVAAGPWTPSLVDPTGGWMPIRPLWGAVVELELPNPTRHVLEQAGIEAAIGAESTHGAGDQLITSVVPLPDASIIGSTFLAAEPDPDEWVEPILQRASRFVPALADAPIRGARACPRPQSTDGLPLVGAVPGWRGLYVCAGHGPWGISTGPAAARMVADLVLGRAPEIPRELDPARFF